MKIEIIWSGDEIPFYYIKCAPLNVKESLELRMFFEKIVFPKITDTIHELMIKKEDRNKDDRKWI